MRSTLVKVLVSLLLFTVISFGISQLFNYFVMADSNLNRTERQFIQSDPPKIICIGDSHPRSAINPQHFPDMFNFTSPGEDYIQTFFKLKHFLNTLHGSSIDLIILQLDNHTFSSFRNLQYNDEYYWSRFINYLDLGKETGHVGYYINKWLIGTIFTYFSGREDLFKYIYRRLIVRNNFESELLVKGYLPRDEDFSKVGDPVFRAKRRTKFLYDGHNLFDAQLVKYFLRTMRLCRNLGIDIVIVSYPVSQIYYEEALYYMAEDEWSSRIDTLLRQQFDIPYLDYKDLFWGYDSLFADSDHLNTTGAEYFSKCVADTIKNLEVISSILPRN